MENGSSPPFLGSDGGRALGRAADELLNAEADTGDPGRLTDLIPLQEPSLVRTLKLPLVKYLLVGLAGVDVGRRGRHCPRLQVARLLVSCPQGVASHQHRLLELVGEASLRIEFDRILVLVSRQRVRELVLINSFRRVDSDVALQSSVLQVERNHLRKLHGHRQVQDDRLNFFLGLRVSNLTILGDDLDLADLFIALV